MTRSSVQSGYLSPQIVVDKASQVAEDLERGPSLSVVQCGAALASQGHIPLLERLWLYNLDISLVPASDLRRLVKCSDKVRVDRVTGDLSTVLSSVQCWRLDIANISLSTADTQQLVAAMVTRVEWLMLPWTWRSWPSMTERESVGQ